MTQVTIINTGVSNIASVEAALKRLGLTTVYAERPIDVVSSNALLLPGVGTFRAGISAIDAQGLREPLIERIQEGKPTLGICLGMQLMCGASEESPEVTGLGVIKQTIRRFPRDVIVPHFGWNSVASKIDEIPDGDAYFANSYALQQEPDGWQCCLCEYGVTFVAAIKKGGVMATQFHPELSGLYGEIILKKWLTEVIC